MKIFKNQSLMFVLLCRHCNCTFTPVQGATRVTAICLELSVPASRCLLMLRSSSAFSLLVNKSSVVPEIRLLSSNCPFRVPEKVRFPSVLRARFFCFSKLQTKVKLRSGNQNSERLEHSNALTLIQKRSENKMMHEWNAVSGFWGRNILILINLQWPW